MNSCHLHQNIKCNHALESIKCTACRKSVLYCPICVNISTKESSEIKEAISISHSKHSNSSHINAKSIKPKNKSHREHKHKKSHRRHKHETSEESGESTSDISKDQRSVYELQEQLDKELEKLKNIEQDNKEPQENIESKEPKEPKENNNNNNNKNNNNGELTICQYLNDQSHSLLLNDFVPFVLNTVNTGNFILQPGNRIISCLNQGKYKIEYIVKTLHSCTLIMEYSVTGRFIQIPESKSSTLNSYIYKSFNFDIQENTNLALELIALDQDVTKPIFDYVSLTIVKIN